MANSLRAWLFRIVFYGLSVPIVLTAPVSALFGQRALIAHSGVWARFHRWALAHLLGIHIRVEGAPSQIPVLYAAKHQAMLETLELTLILRSPAIMLKRELARIPVWGWAVQRYGGIVVDRTASASALRHMMSEARKMVEAGRSVVIFPEGTRVAPGETPPLRPGFAGLYRALDVPVVPIALDSGRVWPRRGMQRPGTVTIRIGDPIPPGLPRREIEARVHAAINALEDRPPTPA